MADLATAGITTERLSHAGLREAVSSFAAEMAGGMTIGTRDALVGRDQRPIHDAQGTPITTGDFTDALLTVATRVNTALRTHMESGADGASVLTTDTHGKYCPDKDARQLNGHASCADTAFQMLCALEGGTVRHVVGLANGPERELDRAATMIARRSYDGFRRVEELIREVDDGFATHASVTSNRDIMRMAWGKAGGKIGDALAEAVAIKTKLYGSARIVVWNDVDQNLTLDEKHNERCPVVPFAKIGYQAHGRKVLEATVFPGLYGHLTEQEGEAGAWGRQLFRQVGRSIFNLNVLPGVRETFDFAGSKGVEMHILTRNLRLVGQGVAQALGVPQSRVHGRCPSDHTSIEKPHLVLREIRNHPNTIHVVVDDGDKAIVDAVAKPFFPDGTRAHEHFFIIARQSLAGRPYELDQALVKAGAPHGVHGDEYWTVREILAAGTRGF